MEEPWLLYGSTEELGEEVDRDTHLSCYLETKQATMKQDTITTYLIFKNNQLKSLQIVSGFMARRQWTNGNTSVSS